MNATAVSALLTLLTALIAHPSAAFNLNTSSPSIRTVLYQHAVAPPASCSEHDGSDSARAVQLLKQSTLIVPLVVSAFAFTTVPLPANAGDVTKGSEVFTTNCIGCHRGGQNFVKEQKTLQKEALEKYVGLDEAKVTKFFKDSFVHKVVGGKLTEDEVADVVSYVVDQAVGEKW